MDHYGIHPPQESKLVYYVCGGGCALIGVFGGLIAWYTRDC